MKLSDTTRLVVRLGVGDPDTDARGCPLGGELVLLADDERSWLGVLSPGALDAAECVWSRTPDDTKSVVVSAARFDTEFLELDVDWEHAEVEVVYDGFGVRLTAQVRPNPSHR
jgi:hypothetical protein